MRWVFLFCLILFLGCQDTGIGTLALPAATVRSQIQEREAGAAWTREFTAPAPKSRPVQLTQESIAAFGPSQAGNNVYPELPGFASLDTSNLGAPMRAVINAFCRAVIAGKQEDAQALARAETRFFVDIFFADTALIVFSKTFVLGKPEILGETWQVPVRFLAGKGHLDVFLFLMYDTKWVIDQITYGELSSD
jgi:hypothetical protein